MNIELSREEARVIGCLIEKQITTPDQYPLSLNALTNACNQKSNRDPVMSLDEPSVQHIVDTLARRRFCNSEYGTLKFSPQELAIVCELLLRGPQTPGELRTRASRMAAFTDTDAVEAALARLTERADGPFVVRLPREPGRRDARYAHLFSGAVAAAAPAVPGETPSASAEPSRLERLEEQVRELRAELAAIKARLPS